MTLLKFQQITDWFKCLENVTQLSIPYILTESCSSLKNLLKILSNSCSEVLGRSLIMSFRTIAATFLT